jgi:hypothetical protein
MRTAISLWMVTNHKMMFYLAINILISLFAIIYPKISSLPLAIPALELKLNPLMPSCVSPTSVHNP